MKKRKWLDFFIDKLYDLLEQKRLERVERKRQRFLNMPQSVGYGVRLNGDDWTFRMPSQLVLGNNVHIGNKAYFHAGGGIIIGDNTHISRNVSIYSVNHQYEGIALPYDSKESQKPVVIEENVWIGMNVSIVPGVRIGKGAIIGIGTVVNRNVAPYEIVGTDKTVHIKHRDQVRYETLNADKKFGGISGRPLSEEEVASFIPTYEEMRHAPIVFVLGTGRSGSQAITETLNQHPECKAFHEDIMQLIRISTQLAYRTEESERYLSQIKDIFQCKVWQATKDQILVHSDQRFWNLVPFLASYFPNAKFVHLYRDPVPCIKSMLARNWYQDNEYFEYNTHQWALFRLQGDQVGAFSPEAWAQMTNVERCTWYWTYVNQKIEAQLASLDTKRTMFINLKDLDSHVDGLQRIMGVEQLPIQVKVTNKTKKNHQQNHMRINEEAIEAALKKLSSEYLSSSIFSKES